MLMCARILCCRTLHHIHHKYNKEHTLSPFAGLAFHPLDGILQVPCCSAATIACRQTLGPCIECAGAVLLWCVVLLLGSCSAVRAHPM